MSSDREHRHVLREIIAPGLGLAAVAMAAVVVMGGIDALRSDRYHSLAALLTPDPVAAAWTMALLGTAEGVAIAIVIVVVVLGVQLTADRYSPRIIDISDRVVAYDWVEDHMRELIPILRSRLHPDEPQRPRRSRRNGDAKPVRQASSATRRP